LEFPPKSVLLAACQIFANRVSCSANIDGRRISEFMIAVDEDFPSYHVEVGQGSPGSPVDGTGFDRLDPQVVGEHERKYGNALEKKIITQAPVPEFS
jgi:hypothetical protein